MKKNYILLIVLTLAAGFPQFGFAQIMQSTNLVANNDYCELSISPGQGATQILPSVLGNDTVNGQPANLSNVLVTQLLNDFPFISIEPDGSVWYTPVALSTGGTFTIAYRICEFNNPNNCTTALVTVNLGGCLATSPTISNIVNADCFYTGGSLTVTVAPTSSPWNLQIYREGQYDGSYNESVGLTFNIGFLHSGVYEFVLNDGFCSSLPTRVYLGPAPCLEIEALGTYADYNNDGLTNAGDVVNYQFTLINNANVEINSVALDMPLLESNLTISGTPIPTLAAGASNNTAYTGVRVLSQADINNGSVSDWISGYATAPGPTLLQALVSATTNLDIRDGIKLNAFIDSNNNEIQDAGEPNFTQGSFHYEINNSGIVNEIITSTGHHILYETNPTHSYDISYTFNNPVYYTLNISSYSDITVAQDSGVVTYNFPITTIPHSDFAVHLSQSGAPPRPGFTYQNKIHYRNNGNLPASGTLTFTHDALATITEISQAGTVATATGFNYGFTNLMPNQMLTLDVTMQVPVIPTVALGDVLTNTVSITIPDSDMTPVNNTFSLSQIIVGSYDPNDKTESHGGKIVHSEFTADDYLTYIIRFENTGTAEAINVKVEDVLESKLDETSVRMLDASHDYVLEREGNNLIWRFDAINLPPSVEGTNVGHGYIIFQVKPKSGYAIGDVITNSADIVFDFNPAIVTEPVTTEFVTALGVAQFENDNLAIYPNPAKDMLTVAIKNGTIDSIVLNDLLGKTVLSKSKNENRTQLDISHLSQGIYFVKVTVAGKEKMFKLIKE